MWVGWAQVRHEEAEDRLKLSNGVLSPCSLAETCFGTQYALTWEEQRWDVLCQVFLVAVDLLPLFQQLFHPLGAANLYEYYYLARQ